MKHYFSIADEKFSVTFYNDSANICQIKGSQQMGFFIRYVDFDIPQRWFWYPSEAAEYVKKLYKNRMFL